MLSCWCVPEYIDTEVIMWTKEIINYMIVF